MELFFRPRAQSLVGLALTLVTLGCPQHSSATVEPAAVPPAEVPTAPAGQQWSWTARSADGTARVEQRLTAPGHCLVEATGGAEEWRVDECRGDAIKLHFVSADGRGLLVIDPLPEKGLDWGAATVVSLYTLGRPTAEANAAALLDTAGHLRKFSSRYAWLQGTGGLPGVGPRYADAQFVEAVTVNNRTLRLGFTAADIPPAAVRIVEDQTPTRHCNGMLEWADAKGETHYTDTLSNVPAALRKRVKCTSGGEIAVVAAAPKGASNPGPVAPDLQPEKQVLVAQPQIYCSYSNLQKREGGLDIIFPGAGILSNHSFCTPGPMGEAVQRCERDSKARFPNASACSCTADKASVSSHCN